MTNTIQCLLEEKFEIKKNYNRDELQLIVDFLRNEIGIVAIDVYRNKIGEISRDDVILGKISFNPRHLLKALSIEGIISKTTLEEFIRLDDESFYNLIFRSIKSYEEELLRIIEDVENLINTLKQC
ncbi:hypothetical protein [Solibacillus sp. FSL K6-1126]|uniref:hypothetical protein n=1 Tax=Solibacillus sp. FSL K6-1126 TaxID=2921463 RepID=UPI0030F81C89